jgi:hypothetical protein
VHPTESELFELWEEAGEDELAEWRAAAVASIEQLRAAITD